MGTINGQPVAKKEPFLPWEDMPAHKRVLLKNCHRTTREWTAIFEDILTENDLEDSELRDVTSQEGQASYCDSYFRIAREDLLHHEVETDSEEEDVPEEC